MRNVRIVLVALLTALWLLPAAPALADDGGPGGQVVFGDNFTLDSGETMSGDLIVFGGNVTLEEDSRVDGNVVVWGGNAEVSGTVGEDLAVFGGNVRLRSTAVIERDLIVADGNLEREEGAEVRGQVVERLPGMWWSGPVVVPFHGEYGPGFRSVNPLRWTVEWTLSAVWAVVRMMLVVLLMAVLAGLVAVLWPQPAARVGRSALRAPLPAFGLGLLTALIVIVLLVSLCLTVIGLVAGVAAGVATVFGWAALGILIGQRLLGERGHPFWSAALGAGLLTLVSGLFDLLPCIGWIGGFLVACWVLGAVILTRFGAVDYPPLSAAPSVTVAA